MLSKFTPRHLCVVVQQGDECRCVCKSALKRGRTTVCLWYAVKQDQNYIMSEEESDSFFSWRGGKKKKKNVLAYFYFNLAQGDHQLDFSGFGLFPGHSKPFIIYLFIYLLFCASHFLCPRSSDFSVLILSSTK